MTLEEAIASCEKSAERYHKAFLHCKSHGGEFYQEEAESNKTCYEHDRQLAAWLRELQERRKAPEIITCGECVRGEVGGCELYCMEWMRYTSYDGYCHRGMKRRIE